MKGQRDGSASCFRRGIELSLWPLCQEACNLLELYLWGRPMPSPDFHGYLHAHVHTYHPNKRTTTKKNLKNRNMGGYDVNIMHTWNSQKVQIRKSMIYIFSRSPRSSRKTFVSLLFVRFRPSMQMLKTLSERENGYHIEHTCICSFYHSQDNYSRVNASEHSLYRTI